MRLWILAFAAGVLCLQQQPVLPEPSLLLALAVIALLSLSMLAVGMNALMPGRAPKIAPLSCPATPRHAKRWLS